MLCKHEGVGAIPSGSTRLVARLIDGGAADPVRSIEFRHARSERLSRLTDLDVALAG